MPTYQNPYDTLGTDMLDEVIRLAAESYLPKGDSNRQAQLLMEGRPEEEKQRTVMGEGSRGFLQYLKDAGYVGDVETHPTMGDSKAYYYPGQKKIEVYAINPALNQRAAADALKDTASSVAHEGVHALQFNASSRVRDRIMPQIEAAIREGGKNAPELVMPTRWIEGRFDDNSFPIPERVAKSYPELAAGVEVSKLLQANSIKSAIPKGTKWSGVLTNQTDIANALNLQGDPAKMYLERSEPAAVNIESTAYYNTHEAPLSSKERRKTLGLYLRDKGLPWDVVEGVLSDMGLSREAVGVGR